LWSTHNKPILDFDFKNSIIFAQKYSVLGLDQTQNLSSLGKGGGGLDITKRAIFVEIEIFFVRL
jgi:hypothetical protein